MRGIAEGADVWVPLSLVRKLIDLEMHSLTSGFPTKVGQKKTSLLLSAFAISERGGSGH